MGMIPIVIANQPRSERRYAKSYFKQHKSNVVWDTIRMIFGFIWHWSIWLAINVACLGGIVHLIMWLFG